MGPNASVLPISRRHFGAFLISLIALAGCRDVNGPQHSRVARPALADKSGIPDTLPFHVDENFRAVPGSTPVVCGPGLSIPGRLVGEGTITPHLGRSHTRLFARNCQILDGIPRFNVADTIAGATGDSLFLDWIVSIVDIHDGLADLRIEILALDGSGWYYHATGSAIATGTIDLATGEGSYRGSGSIAPRPSKPIARMPLLIPETITAAEEHFTCGLTLSGKAYCWGRNERGQLGDGTTTNRSVPTPVSGGHLFKEISTGASHTCALTIGGSVFCWGSNSTGQLGNADKTDHPLPTLVGGGIIFVQIAVGGNHTCGRITSGAVYCWGDNPQGQLGDGTVTERAAPTLVHGGLSFSIVKTGTSHTCALTSADVAYCWGSNASGELGDSTKTERHVPRLVSGGHAFTQISTGPFHTCALNAEGVAYCWGQGAAGELGDGGSADVYVPGPVYGGYHYTRISAGYLHTCAVSATDGRAWCWGNNDNGELGDATTQMRRIPVAVSSAYPFVQVSAGNYHSCGVTTSHVAYCWGSNTLGEVGDGSTSPYYIATEVSSALGDSPALTQITTGERHSCGLTATGEAWCWGANNLGQLGDSTTTTRYVATKVAGGHVFSQISAGAYHTCGLAEGALPYCWGDGGYGQIGDGFKAGRVAPTAVAGVLRLKQIRAGGEHTCGLDAYDEVYCWGDNLAGQLGDGTTSSNLVPLLVPGGPWQDLAVGDSHTCALDSVGNSYCWGNDGGIAAHWPTLYAAERPLVHLTGGKQYTCGWSDTGDSYCWGINPFGQLSDGTTVGHVLPARIFGETDPQVGESFFDQITAGMDHACGRAKYSQRLTYCWGSNSFGQLGDGTTTQRLSATGVSSSLVFDQIASGGYHSCGVSNGVTYCWGRNDYGQLGNDGTANRLVPTVITRLFFKG